MAESEGLGPALLGAAAVLAVCAAMGLALPLADLGARDLDPMGRWQAPDTALRVDGRSGPVVVTVEWRVAESDVPPFLALMAERRRIRRRDGAHDWHLLRDLAEPELWVERYRTATWLDYIRLNTRVTRDDAELFQRLRAFHVGGGRPPVRRLIEREPGTLDGDGARAARELAVPLAEPTHPS